MHASSSLAGDDLVAAQAEITRIVESAQAEMRVRLPLLEEAQQKAAAKVNHARQALQTARAELNSVANEIITLKANTNAVITRARRRLSDMANW